MNLVAMKTQSTMNVATAPTALITIDFFQCELSVTSSVTKVDPRWSDASSSASGKGSRSTVL